MIDPDLLAGIGLEFCLEGPATSGVRVYLPLPPPPTSFTTIFAIDNI
jgi:hypothetical protein